MDLNLFKAVYSSILGSPTYNPDMDFTGDGVINTLDLGIFKQRYSKAPGPSKVPTPEQLSYYHTDVLGSPVLATTAQGSPVWREAYRPYGARIDLSPAALSNTRGYTAHPPRPRDRLALRRGALLRPRYGPLPGRGSGGLQRTEPV